MKEKKVVLSIKDLHVRFSLRGQVLHAIRGVSLDVYQGESLAIVGESGSGKSVFVKCAMGLLDANGSIESGSISYNGMELTKFARDKDWQKIRGREIAMVFQDPMTSLNPLKTIGKQIQEAVELHQGLKGKAAYDAVLEVLADVGIDDPQRRFKQYPHEFSGGMRQRVVIAIAVACRPKILICDEPTTALDVTIQGQILDIIKNLQKKNQTSVIMITHDLGVVANIAQKIAVMYSGIIVESGTCEDIFYRPRHPYTWALIRSVPRLDLKNKQELATIPGTPPDLLNPPVGCPFCTRCSYCMPICKEEMPEATEFGGEHKAACWLHHPMAPKVEMPNLEGGEL